MKEKTIDFYYFSGTGNTLLVVKKMKETFQKNRTEVHLHRIEKSDPKRVNLSHTIGIGFPIAELSTYPFVWDFIKSLPPASGTEIFMVDTLAGFSGGIAGPIREIVKKKGYEPIGAKEIIMPPNFFYIQNEEASRKKVEKGLAKAEEHANDILNRKSKWGRVPVLSDAMSSVSSGLLKLSGSGLSQKWFNFQADESKCNNCGICVDLCPTGNIKMEEGEYPEHGLNCEYCMRCVSFCPQQAIPCKFNYQGKTYQAVTVKEFLKND